MDNKQFTPNTVDEEIERTLIARESTTPSQRTLQALHEQLSARQDEPALNRVWTRLAQHRMAQQSSLAARSVIDRRVAMARQRKEHQMSASSHTTSRAAKGFTLFATAAFLTVLLGSLAFVFQLARQQHSHTGNQAATIVAPPKNTLYTLVGNTAYALDGVTHQPLWVHQFPVHITKGKPDNGHNPIQVVNGVYYMWWSDNTIYALNTKDGSLLWKYKANQRVDSLYFGSGLVYFSDPTSPTSHQATLKALDATTGTLKWQKPSTSDFFGLTVVTVANNILYAYDSTVSSSGETFNLYAFNAANGSQLWKQTQPNLLNETGGQVVNGTFYLSLLDNNVTPVVSDLYAYDAATGHLRWQKQYDHDTRLSSVENGILYMTAYSTKDNTHTPDYIYVEDTIEALSTQDGTLLWKYTASSPNGVSDPAIVNGTVYVTLVNEKKNNGSVVALNATTGKARWTHSLAEKPTYIAPTVVENTIAVGVAGGKVVLLHLSSGSLISTISSVPAQQDTTNVTVGQ
jgi:outer membrane protein assembly factor BamB